ncbi:MAG TPA: PP2C family protein-serine/threonine phosphatase [Candidatus Acidoferrales bacterium]|jgi:serine phosphatase RsbU (regulator of sigma subunit)|nr:PP2C family protein-serine/threonine phosphatase [Candidatus Acidoferrales bacterium]
MGTSSTVESELRKAPGSLSDPGGTVSVRPAYAGGWRSRVAAELIVALKSSTWWAFLVVVLAIGCVAYADNMVEGVSLGYLYILPLSFSAILLAPRLTYTLVVLCIFFHDLFGPPIHHIQGRILHNLAALIGFTFVVLILQWFVAQRNALNELTRHQRDALLKEVELAAEVQRLFLPRSDPDMAGFEIAGAMHPARVVGGDYYDYLERPDGSMRLVIADVSGKGVAAALLMSATAAAVQLETNEPRKLCEVANHLNNELFALQDDGRFVTVLLGELDPRSGRLRYTNCGHNPALVFRREGGDADWLHASSTPVGISPELSCALEETTLAPGDIMVWYTDGLTEASDRDAKEFGTKRLLESVRLHSGRTAREICDQLWSDVAAFTQRDSLDDDLTVMVIKMKSVLEPGPRDFPPFSD